MSETHSCFRFTSALLGEFPKWCIPHLKGSSYRARRKGIGSCELYPFCPLAVCCLVGLGAVDTVVPRCPEPPRTVAFEDWTVFT